MYTYTYKHMLMIEQSENINSINICGHLCVAFVEEHVIDNKMHRCVIHKYTHCTIIYL